MKLQPQIAATAIFLSVAAVAKAQAPHGPYELKNDYGDEVASKEMLIDLFFNPIINSIRYDFQYGRARYTKFDRWQTKVRMMPFGDRMILFSAGQDRIWNNQDDFEIPFTVPAPVKQTGPLPEYDPLETI